MVVSHLDYMQIASLPQSWTSVTVQRSVFLGLPRSPWGIGPERIENHHFGQSPITPQKTKELTVRSSVCLKSYLGANVPKCYQPRSTAPPPTHQQPGSTLHALNHLVPILCRDTLPGTSTLHIHRQTVRENYLKIVTGY